MNLLMHENDKRTYVKGLGLDCPFCNALETCPMNPLRDLPPPQLIETINSLPIETIDSIIEHHQVCQENRLLDGDS